MGRRLALLVATYRYADPGLRRLTSPAHDAEALAAVLRDPDIATIDTATATTVEPPISAATWLVSPSTSPTASPSASPTV